MPKSYYVRIRARTGLLLGGVRSTESSRFESRRDACDWAWQARNANREAGRDIDPEYEVISSDRAPEIPAQR